MSNRQRSFLFFSLVLLFLVLGPLIVFYSQGYRLDYQEKKIVQTGAFYFRITPKSVSIEIVPQYSGKPISRTTDFIFGTAFVENLLPKKYELKIGKNGYYPWKKSLDIGPKMVTELKNITLIPENPEFKVLTEEVDDFFYFPETNKFVFKKRVSDNDKSFSLSAYDSRTGFGNAFFTHDKEVSFEIIEISIKSGKILMRVDEKDSIEHYVLEIDGKKEPIKLDFPEKVSEASFHPKNNGKIIFLKDGSIFIYDYEVGEISSIIDNVLTYEIRGDSVFFWLSKDGFLFKGFENYQKINRKAFEIKEDGNYEIFFPNSLEIMIKENDLFYLFNKELLEFQEKFRSMHNPKTSPDFQKMVYFSDHEIRIFFLDDENDQPQRKYGDDVFITRFSEKLENINWYTSHYIVFTISDQVKIIEIDNRDNINIVFLEEMKKPKLFFSFSEKRIYVLSDEKVFVSKKLIP